ncbi:bacteriohemerythrin [Geobacter sp. AOG2]|uniref:bacteriohemerythrin n=1 Tax=Geobacter sp. AOG2 TaxID=1566347 RepID=UPI001CC4952D|nr:bacteriohemerythrin [Geobacter sp. AOG2]GFE61199.1 hemerythrin [Geobacter sp. AOG2]
MTLIKWDNSLSLKVNVLDEHHRHLVGLLNKSYNAIQLNDKHIIELILGELFDYAKYHFGTEEHLMHENDFPSLLSHEKDHNYFFYQIDELQSKLRSGESLYNVQIVVFLRDWLVNHILVKDRALADYLVGNGAL